MSELCPVSGKRCLTKSDAEQQAAALRHRGMMPSAWSTRAYRCPDWKSHAHLGHWHVGRRVRRRNR